MELSNSEKRRDEALKKILGTPIVTRAYKWRAQTANSDLTPNSSQELLRGSTAGGQEDATHHARMKAQQREIPNNLLQKEKELAIKANPRAGLKTALTHAMARRTTSCHSRGPCSQVSSDRRELVFSCT
jgi:hypothetical protein